MVFSKILYHYHFCTTYNQAVVNLAYELNIDSLALISSSSMTVETFLAEATALGIRVPNILELNTELIKDHGKKQVRLDSKYILNQCMFSFKAIILISKF